MPSQRVRVHRARRVAPRRGRPPRIVWLVDWSDLEQTDFVAAFAELGYEQKIIRSRHTGLTVGTRWHRLYSYPAYVYLALRALLARADVVVAWQPIVASVLGYLPFRPPVVAIEPVLVENDRRLVSRFSLRALRRIERLVLCTQGLADRFLDRDFSTDRVLVIERGVPFRNARNGPGCEYLFAGGREHRDWIALREAAAGIELPVRLGAPNSPADGGSLQLLPTLSRVDYVEQLRGARALVVPLKDNTRRGPPHHPRGVFLWRSRHCHEQHRHRRLRDRWCRRARRSRRRRRLDPGHEGVQRRRHRHVRVECRNRPRARPLVAHSFRRCSAGRCGARSPGDRALVGVLLRVDVT